MITELLNYLAVQQDNLAAIEAEKAAILAEIMAPIQQAIDDLEVEYAERISQQTVLVTRTVIGIKAAVTEHGATVKGDRLQAVYAKGRVSWDNKALDGYAVAHPELFAFRKEGEPSVSIRTVK